MITYLTRSVQGQNRFCCLASLLSDYNLKTTTDLLQSQQSSGEPVLPVLDEQPVNIRKTQINHTDWGGGYKAFLEKANMKQLSDLIITENEL